jgi:hypothetical protein
MLIITVQSTRRFWAGLVKLVAQGKELIRLWV